MGTINSAHGCPKCRTTDFNSCHSMYCPMRKESVVEPSESQEETMAELHLKGCELAYSEGWNEALDFIIKMIAEQKSLSEAFYDKAHDSESAAESQLCAKLINELQKLRK